MFLPIPLMRFFRWGLIIFQAVFFSFILQTNAQKIQADENNKIQLKLTNSSINSSAQIHQRLSILKNQIEQKSVRLTLDECLKIGLRQNMQLSAAYSSIQQYEYKLIGVKRQYLPTLSISSLPPFLGSVQVRNTATQYQQFVVNQAGAAQIVNTPVSSNSTQSYNQFGPYLTLSWSFFQPSLSSEVRAQQAQLQQQRLAFDVTARSVILSIQQAYFQLQASKSLIDSFERIYQINLDQFNFVQERQRVGLTNIGSVEQSKAQLFAQMNQLIGYYESYLQNAASLAFAMNEPADRIVLPAEPLGPSGTWNDSLDDTLDQATALREEIQAYLQSEEASLWNARASIRKYLPTFMLQGVSYGLFNKGSANSVVGYESSYVYQSIGLGLTWNLFDGGVAAAQSQSYLAASRNARYQAAYEKLQVREQIKRSYVTYQMALLSLENAKANLHAANNTIAVNRARFGVGLADITSLVQSMQLLGSASEAYSSTLLQYNNAVAELYRYSAKWPEGVAIPLAEKVDQLRND